MSRDPLLVLKRLRAMEVDAARRALAEQLGTLAAAAAHTASLREALQRETQVAAPLDLAAWLPRALAERAAAARAEAQAAAAAEAARDALAQARAAERAAERLVEKRDAAARLRLNRRDRAALDEAAANRRS
ncbi:hypothetical protein [Roseomonas sp. BN140053]|uniref:hypothetical protein n=1 Tax=Roseomonas sp. BN140053 TaxID=3391898 RepID=UPI0039ED3F02